MYSYPSVFAFSGLAVFIAVVLTIAVMVLLYLKVIPKKLDGTFSNKFMQMIHDYFNFKKLFLESVLKFLFTLLTVVCVAIGVAMIATTFLGVFRNLFYIIRYDMPFAYLASSFFSGIFGGLATLVVGPTLVRISYEGIMMFILLVKNVIEINNKTKND